MHLNVKPLMLVTVWSLNKIKYITTLEHVQKTARKLASKFKHLPYKDRLSKLHARLPTLAFRRLCGDMVKVFKILCGIYDKNTVPSICFPTTNGHNKKLFKPFSSKNVHQKYFTVHVIEIWNSSPYDIADAMAVNLFKQT